MKLYLVVKKMEEDCEAAYQVAMAMRRMTREMIDLALENGFNPDAKEIEMLQIVDDIEGRLGRIDDVIRHFNQYPEYIDQEVMEGLIYGESFTYSGIVDEGLKTIIS